MIDSHALFVIWLAFTILVICAVIPFAVWAVRSGHFSRFDYASRLPLKSRIVEENEEEKKERNKDVSA
jgi:cbb3-type cytochrome oxidase subunit 3